MRIRFYPVFFYISLFFIFVYKANSPVPHYYGGNTIPMVLYYRVFTLFIIFWLFCFLLKKYQKYISCFIWFLTIFPLFLLDWIISYSILRFWLIPRSDFAWAFYLVWLIILLLLPSIRLLLSWTILAITKRKTIISQLQHELSQYDKK